MKFDKLMEIGFKIIACITCIVLVVGLVSCCRFYAVHASAVEIDAGVQAQIDEYLQAYETAQADIDLSWNKDEDGNSSAHLRIYGLQKALLTDSTHLYANMDFSAAPDTVTFSGSGRSGFYYLSGQYGTRRLCSIILLPEYSSSNFGQVFVNADDFTVSVSAVTPANGTMTVYNDNYDGRHPWDIKCNVRLSADNVIDIVGTGLCTTYSNFMVLQNGSGNTSRGFSINGDPNYIPTVSSWTFQYTPSPTLYGQPEQYTLPESTVDTSTPWDYYNDTLLPYIREQFPDLPDLDDFLVFPDGYYPVVPPTEPAPPNYEDTENTKIVPIIVGIPIPIDVLDDLGEVVDVLDILADLLPGGGIQFNIDGVTFTFPRDGDSVVINGKQYPLPLPDVEIDGHIINLPDNLHFDFDGIPFTINPDGTITINDTTTLNLPIGTPTQLSTEYDDYVYEYEIPTIEKLNIVDGELSAPDLTNYVDGISLMSGAMSDFIDGVGLMPFIIACLSIGAITYVIWKIGG